MKKFGFTLAEVLISMSIIGVVASITAPTLINIMPNKDKVQTIKYQKLISEINADLLNNRTLYSEGKWDGSTITVPEYTNTVFITKDNINKLKRNKYAYLLKEKLEVVNEDNPISTEAKFKTADGYTWDVRTEVSGSKPKTIIIDINGNEGPNTVGSSSKKYPDQFIFSIDENGYAKCDPNLDKITCRYLNCPFYMNNRKLDYECIDHYTGTTGKDKGCVCK